MTALSGHNRPPSPFEEVKGAIETLHEEATHWLDGDTVAHQATADAISNLLNLLRSAKNEADDERKAEAKPFDDGKKEVQERYKPVLALADTAMDVCKDALKPWLERLDREQREREAEARRIAEEKAASARKAIEESDRTNLAEREASERAIQEAKQANIQARAAEKQTAKSGTVGRSVSMRTTLVPVMDDMRLAAAHYWYTNREDFEAFLMKLAKEDVARGQRTIPGFTVNEERTVV